MGRGEQEIISRKHKFWVLSDVTFFDLTTRKTKPQTRFLLAQALQSRGMYFCKACSPAFPDRAQVSGAPRAAAPGEGGPRSVRTHDGEQHVVQQQREEHDEEDELLRVAPLLQPAEHRQLAQGHGSGARLRARRAVRGRAGRGIPAPRCSDFPGRRGCPGAARTGGAGRSRASPLGSPAGRASPRAPALPVPNAPCAVGAQARARAVRSRSPPPPRVPFSHCALGKRAGPAHCEPRAPRPAFPSHPAAPGSASSGAPALRRPRGQEAGSALPRGRLRLPAWPLWAPSVRPAVPGRSLRPGAAARFTGSGSDVTGGAGRGGEGGWGAPASAHPARRGASAPCPDPLSCRLCAWTPRRPRPKPPRAQPLARPCTSPRALGTRPKGSDWGA